MMMHRLLLLFFSIGLLAACRPVKRIQKIETAINTRDTSVRVAAPADKPVDSLWLGSQLVRELAGRQLAFRTFNAKVRLDYTDNSGGGQATAGIRIQRDSLIWVSLSQLGIEGYRVLIRPDSVWVMNKLGKYVQARSIRYLQELTQLPVDFAALQNIIVGNPIFTSTDVKQYRTGDGEIDLLMVTEIFKHLLTLNAATNDYVHSKLDDVNPLRNRTCDITLDKYENRDGRRFSTFRKLAVSEEQRLDIELDFKQVSFDQPLSFPFNIPGNYKRR